MADQSSASRIRFPDHLPWLAAGLTLTLSLGYVAASLAAEFSIGRPSSTAAVGLFVGPIISVIFSVVALVGGLVMRFAWRKSGIAPQVVPTWLVRGIAIVTVGAVVYMVISARTTATAFEFARRPHVILDSTRIHKQSPAPVASEPRVEAPLLFSNLPNVGVAPVEWNSRAVSASTNNEGITVFDAAGTPIAATNLRNFDYVTKIRAVPFCARPDGTSDLAVMVTLRATSNRSMLILYGVDGTAFYQEHLNRTATGPGWPGQMFVQKTDGRETLIVETGQTVAYTCSGS